MALPGPAENTEQEIKPAPGVLFVLFETAGLLMAMEYRDVREIIPYSLPVPVPQAPAYIGGIINFGGQICPVISVSALTCVAAPEISSRTCFIMNELDGLNRAAVGITADRFIGSVKIMPGNIEPCESGVKGFVEGNFAGVARVNGSPVLVLRVSCFLKGLNFINTN